MSIRIPKRLNSERVSQPDLDCCVICLAVRFPRDVTTTNRVHSADAIVETRIINADVPVQVLRKRIICGTTCFVQGGIAQRSRECAINAVSYTHLTLPTNREV